MEFSVQRHLRLCTSQALESREQINDNLGINSNDLNEGTEEEKYSIEESILRPYPNLDRSKMPALWEEITAQKQSQLKSRIPKEWLLSPDLLSPPNSSQSLLSIPVKAVPSILTPREFSLTSSHDATSLAQAIRERKLTAEEVAIAYCKRAAIAQQVCFCLTEIFFEEGIERAKWLDQEFRKTGKVVGPLHGVPVSMKDTFKIKGYDSSIGMIDISRLLRDNRSDAYMSNQISSSLSTLSFSLCDFYCVLPHRRLIDRDHRYCCSCRKSSQGKLTTRGYYP